MTELPILSPLARENTPRLFRPEEGWKSRFVSDEGLFYAQAMGRAIDPGSAHMLLETLRTRLAHLPSKHEFERELDFIRETVADAGAYPTHAALLTRAAKRALRQVPRQRLDRRAYELAAANALAFSLSLHPTPLASRLLHTLLTDAGNSALKSSVAYLPLLSWLGSRLDARGPYAHEFSTRVAAVDIGVPTGAGPTLKDVVDTFDLLAGVTRTLADHTPLLSREDIQAWLDVASAWAVRARVVFKRLPAAAGLLQPVWAALDTLADRIVKQPPLYFGFPIQGALPGIRLLDYLQPPTTPEFAIFPGGELPLALLADVAQGPLEQWIAHPPALADSVQRAGGEAADFDVLANVWYDRIDEIRAQHEDELRSYGSNEAFLCALACRVLGAARTGCVEGVTDLMSFLKTCIDSAEQRRESTTFEGVNLLDAWIRGWRSTTTDEARKAAAVPVRRTHGVRWHICSTNDTGSSSNWPALTWRHCARNQLLAVLELLADVAAHFISHDVLPSEDRQLLRKVHVLQRYYQSFLGDARPAKALTPRPVAPTKEASSTPTPPKPCQSPQISARAAVFCRVVAGEPLQTQTLAKQIRESWSMNKAERLFGELQLLPAQPAMLAGLEAEFPWMRAVIERVTLRIQRSVLLGHSTFRIPPLLLIGGYGCGKTRFARRLAERQQLPWRLLVAGGSTDNRQPAGTARGWSNAYPSLPADFMGESGVANGLIVIDEVDKESTRRDNGRMTDTLLQLLEPGNARTFDDVFFGFALDCSALTGCSRRTG